MKTSKEVPFYADPFFPEEMWRKDDEEKDDDEFEYLLERIRALHLRKNALTHQAYIKKLREYCRRLQDEK